MNTFNVLSAALLFIAGVLVAQGEVFDCANFNPNICTMDMIPFCLTNGTVVSSRCSAQRAVCREQATIDETFAACSQNSNSNFDCNGFNPMVCAKDAIPFCLHNGTIVRGSCLAKRAVCLESQSVDDDFSSCNTARNNLAEDDGNNTATAMTAVVPLVVALVFTTLL